MPRSRTLKRVPSNLEKDGSFLVAGLLWQTMMPRTSPCWTVAALVLCAFACSRADVALPKIFGDNMVLQRGTNVPVWGSAAPGEEVSVRFAGQEKRAKAGAEGNWRVSLAPLQASAEPREMLVAGTNTLRLTNVLVGEVWLCSGQSNMEMPVALGVRNGVEDPKAPAVRTDATMAADVKGPGFPEIRLFRAEKVVRPPDVASDGWTGCGGHALARFSAIGYVFAREIQSALGVPVGMIQSAWGGQPIEAFTPQQDGFKKGRAGEKFEGLVRPLVPFAVRGVLWYQGESNIVDGNDGLRYADKMATLIAGWRAAWGRQDLPFYYVQVAPYAYSKRKDKIPHPETALPELWEAQALALKIPGTAMVPTIDLLDDPRELHPQGKRPIGERLSKVALAHLYGKSGTVHEGPVFERAEWRGDTAVLHFRGSSLKSRDSQPLACFEIAGEDGKFVSAHAAIGEHETVLVSAPAVKSPKAARFAWNETARPNLVGAEGWPAFPFRTDVPDWQPQP